jgi:hypothetical protein
MKFLIHYLVRTPLTPLHFDIVTELQPSAANLDHLRAFLAENAIHESAAGARPFDRDDIIIANIIPLPDGDTSAKEIGGS